MGYSGNSQVYLETLKNCFYFTLQVADVSVDVGVVPVDDKHVAVVVPAVHAVDDPHLHVDAVHILSSTEGDPHAVADPHVQVPAEQVSELPLHVVQAPVEQHF